MIRDYRSLLGLVVICNIVYGLNFKFCLLLQTAVLCSSLSVTLMGS